MRAVGAHGIELERFGEFYVTVDSVPIARRALAEDRVLEVLGAADFDVPSSLRAYLEGMRMLCTPMTAAGRYVGVVISEPDPTSPRPDDERQMLWTLGKAVAMASLAREVTTYDERSRQLQQRINLAREIHEHVIQRLFGISLALSREELLDAHTQHRCAAEVQAALGELRAALERPLGRTSRPTALTFAEELSRLRGLHSEVEIVLERGDPQSVPAQLEPLAQSVLVEAVRNVQKHSRARYIGVSLSSDGGTFVLQVRNDGADVPHGDAVGSACAWRRSRRFSWAGCSSMVSPTRASGRSAWSSPPASDQVVPAKPMIPIPRAMSFSAETSEAPETIASEKRLRVLVVDDHDVVHWGFRLMLGQMAWVERCLSARTGEEAIAMCRRYEPHVALVDLLLDGESGPEVCERLRAEAPAPRVLLISGAGGISASAARAAGASGFISKDWPAGEIARLVRMVGTGMTVFKEARNPARRCSPRARARSWI